MAIAGAQVISGGNRLAEGPVPPFGPELDKAAAAVAEKAKALGFGHRDEPHAL